MSQRRNFFILVLLLIIIQSLLMKGFLSEMSFHYLFLHGVPVNSSFVLENKFLIYWLLPVVGMTFYFSGFFQHHLVKYGPYLLIRNYQKHRWVLTSFVNLLFIILVFTAFQFLLFTVLSTNDINLMLNEQFIFMTVLYFLSLCAIIMTQMLMELFIQPQSAHAVINVYVVMSVFASKYIYTFDFPKIIHYIFFPDFGMGFRTGLSNYSNFTQAILSPSISFIILLTWTALMLLLLIHRVKTMDIVEQEA